MVLPHVTKSQTCLAWTNVPVNVFIHIKFVKKYYCTMFQNKRKLILTSAQLSSGWHSRSDQRFRLSPDMFLALGGSDYCVKGLLAMKWTGFGRKQPWANEGSYQIKVWNVTDSDILRYHTFFLFHQPQPPSCWYYKHEICTDNVNGRHSFGSFWPWACLQNVSRSIRQCCLIHSFWDY
jgi:hypothetical protein